MRKTIIINKISPHYTIDKLNTADINDWIDIFEDRMIHWILDPASFLLKYEHNEQCIAHLIINYFEIFMMYYSGEDSDRKSKEFFKKGFFEVYKNSHLNHQFLKRLAISLYENARNGFFHIGLGKKRLFLSTVYNEPFRATLPYNNDGSPDYNGEIGEICINPHLLLRDIAQHF
ncbi:MAG: hypothetical protein PHW12_09290, partial [Smithella sp.]|nr:hypothetical protein [Smithella sp.]